MASSPFPLASPSRDVPNPHPYAIKTSSSAVLTRSNSGQRKDLQSHHYTPLRAKADLAAKQSRFVQTHRHARSLSTSFERPPPIPMPPSPTPYDDDDHALVSDSALPTPPVTWRLKRSDTLPSYMPSKSDSELGVQDLPSNPKLWTPAQLSTYLSSSLRLRGGAPLPVPVARDIATFVLKEHLSGRAFLRMKTADFETFDVNSLWKDALIDASRTLRQSLVQGRIMGFESSSPLSPLSGDDDPGEEVGPPRRPSFSTRALSLDDGPILPSALRLQWEEDKKRISAGRVKGAVDTFERARSASQSSASSHGSARESESRRPSAILVRDAAPVDGADAGFASEEATSESESEASPVKLAAHAVDVDEELAMEDLLVDAPGSWGAEAWEREDDAVHATARRVPVLAAAPIGNAASATLGKSGGSRRLAGLFAPPATAAPASKEAGVEAGVMAEPSGGAGAAYDARLLAALAQRDVLHSSIESASSRLAALEARLDAMEREEDEKSARRQLEEDARRRAVEHASQSRLGSIQRLMPRAFDVFYPRTAPQLAQDAKDKAARANRYFAEEAAIVPMPRYILLFSLGVCAIVIKAMLRRMLTRGTKKY